MTPPGSDPLLMTNLRPAPRSSPFRLIIIPHLIYGAWVLDTFLMEGSISVFARHQVVPLILYTLAANILMGVIVPIACLQSALMSGAVNMFQIGFRPLRRTLPAVAITALFGYLIAVTFSSPGIPKITLLCSLALMLPVAISSIMVCLVLIGTHLQAYVRDQGAVVSIVAGVLVTGILFALSLAGHGLETGGLPGFLPLFVLGIASAVFFFSVRDVWASAVFMTFVLVFVMQGRPDPAYTVSWSPLVIACAIASILALAAGQQYLSRNFITVQIPVGIRKGGGR